MDFFDFPLESYEPITITSNILTSDHLSDSSPLVTVDNSKGNESRLRRNEREKKRQQYLQKLLKRIEVLVNANKPSSEHVFSQRLILDRSIEMIQTLEKKKVSTKHNYFNKLIQFCVFYS